jgi:hypothetical protein
VGGGRGGPGRAGPRWSWRADTPNDGGGPGDGWVLCAEDGGGSTRRSLAVEEKRVATMAVCTRPGTGDGGGPGRGGSLGLRMEDGGGSARRSSWRG